MPRIVFSPMVAMRFLQGASETEPEGDLVASVRVDAKFLTDITGGGLGAMALGRLANGPRRADDWDPAVFDALVSELGTCLSGGPQAQRARLVQGLLCKFHGDLNCEWLAATPGAATCVLRARGALEAYPLLDLLRYELVTRGVAVVSGLPALGHAEGVARATDCLGRDFSGTRVRVGFVRGHLLELAFAVPGCFGHDDEQALEAATVYAEAVLGEQLLDEWVGSIGVSPAPRGGALRVLDSAGQGAAVTPLVELAGLVERGVQGLLAGLPEAPLSKSDASDWTLLEGEPLRDASGAPSMRGMDDTLMASTRCPELLKCFLEGSPVSSRRFSRVGERFVYLKLPSAVPLSQRPEVRARVELALEPYLRDDGVVIGNAVGVGHLYVVLALRQLGPALEGLLECVEAHPGLFPSGSDLRFLDATWADEWLALGP